MDAGEYYNRGLRSRSQRSAADPDQEPVYSRPHQRSRDSRNDASSRRYDNNTGHLADDEPTDDDARGQHHRRQQQQHAKNSPVSQEKSDHRYGNGYVSRDDRLWPGVEASDDAAATYELDHLATFGVTSQHGGAPVKPTDGLDRLNEMDTTIGVWAMKVFLHIDRRQMIVKDQATHKEIECFPVSCVTNPTLAADADMSHRRQYRNVAIFTVQSEAGNQQSSEMHFFQAASKQQAQDLIDDVSAAIAGRFPRSTANQERRTRSPHNVRPASDAVVGLRTSAKSRDDPPVMQARSTAVYQHGPSVDNDDTEPPASVPAPSHQPPRYNDPKQVAGQSDINDQVLLLNHCFDDIERFVASLQQAANAQKELDRRRVMTGGHDPAEDMLRKRARPPPTKDFVDALQKFKLAFNLLPKLKSVLKDPDAVQLVQMLFSPLSVIVEACRDDQGRPVVANNIEAPLLTADACVMLDSCLHPRHAELWKSLGHAWTTPSSRWSGVIPAFYPQFSDGWTYCGVNMDDMGLSLPPANTQQTNDERATNTDASRLPNGFQHLGQQEKPRASAKPTRDVSPSVTKQQQQQQQQPSSSSSSSPPQRASQPAQLTTNVDASQQRFLQQLQARDARIYVAIISRDGKTQKELSVKLGDIIEVIDSSKNWWKVKNHMETTGFVPNTILKPFADSQ